MLMTDKFTKVQGDCGCIIGHVFSNTVIGLDLC